MLLGAFLFTFTACATTPYTNRRQLMIVSEGEEDQMGLQAYDETLKKSKVVEGPDAVLLRNVGQRIAKVADRPDFKWQFALIDDPKNVNAFCLPGGRVAFYTGILPITKDETGLAVVMSHEVAHALARHGAERVSEGMVKSGVTQVAVGTGLIKNEAQLQVAMLAYGVAGELPHSRAQESEADRIGLILMAKAGYDPRAAISFWERMAQAKGGNAPPSFLSTHPSDSRRIDDIKKHLPEALAHYKP